MNTKLRFLLPLILALVPGCATVSDRPPKSDEALKRQIAGVWFTEDLPNLTRHVCARTQYFPDGRFVADYRVSGVDQEEFIRSIGTWDVVSGIFTESVTGNTSPKLQNDTLNRRVRSISPDKMVIVAVAKHGKTATLFRANVPLSSDPIKLRECSHAEFLEQAKALGMRGFLSAPTTFKGKGYNAWRIESRYIPVP